jgi:AraC-like DNA-binding protein
MTDPLTDVAMLLRPRAVLMTEVHGVGRWGIRFPDFNVTNFMVVAAGECWFQLGDAPPSLLRSGDFLFQPEAGGFALMSEPGTATVYGDAAYKAAEGSIIRLGAPPGPATRLVGGYFAVEAINTDLFAALLPRVMLICASESGAGRLAALLDLILAEAQDLRPGRDFMLQRLAEALVIEALRGTATADLPQQMGLLAGLRDRQLAQALYAMHAEVARPWRVAALAAVAGMSRSAFVRRFHDVVGTAPMTYLLRWRMSLTKAALIRGKTRLDDIAAEVGYDSAAALSHAFRRTTGHSPTTFKLLKRVPNLIRPRPL